jgi:hypothetical protein
MHMQVYLFMLHFSGVYSYYDSVNENYVDSIKLHISGKNPEVLLYGFFIRYFLILKENYFGKDTAFKSLAEYNESKQNKAKDIDMVTYLVFAVEFTAVLSAAR